MDCRETRQRLDDLIDGYLDRGAERSVAGHVESCAACAEQLDRLQALRGALRDLPAPEPRPEFLAAALSKATGDRYHGSAAGEGSGRIRRPARMWLGAALAGACAAALALAVLIPAWRSEAPASPDLRLALYEARDVDMLIEAPRDLDGAIVTILVSGGIDLLGFEEQRELRWETDLRRGANVLSLPVIARSLEDGRLTAMVEHGEKIKRFDTQVRIHEAPEAGESPGR